MCNFKLFLVLTVVALSAHAAEEEVVTEDKDAMDKIAVTAPRLDAGDLTIPGGLVSLLANGGAIAAGILAVAALAMLILPLFGFKLCALLGHCDSPQAYQAYSAGPNSVYDYPAAYSQAGTFNNPQYQRRSLEYVGPILNALSSAYEKFNTRLASASKKA